MSPALADLARTADRAAGAAAGVVAGVAAPVLARAFGTVARLRSARGLHPRGSVVGGTLDVSGAGRPTGSEWIDRARRERVVVRFSRATGLPQPLPDVLGIAIRSTGDDGRVTDLLLSSTGRGPVLRHVLAPGRDPMRIPYTSIVRFQSPTGPLLVGALPDPTGPADRSLRLAVARPGGTWEPFATLTLDDNPAGDADGDLHFEPVANTPPGLRMPAPLARLRRPSYRASREAYHDEDR